MSKTRNIPKVTTSRKFQFDTMATASFSLYSGFYLAAQVETYIKG